MVEKSRQIPVSLALLPRLAGKLSAALSAATDWTNTARKTFISPQNPLTLLEVNYVQYLCMKCFLVGGAVLRSRTSDSEVSGSSPTRTAFE